MKTKIVTKEQIEYAISKSKNMCQASKILNISHTTFKKYASQFDEFVPFLKNGRRGMNPLNITKEQIEYAVSASKTMLGAAKILDVKFSTFIRYAKKYNLYAPNQSGAGTIKPKDKIPLEKIFSNSVAYRTSDLRKRLIEEKYLPDECSNCGINTWMGNPITLELDHINGDRNDNRLENLRILCPNCHSQTETFCRKNTRERKPDIPKSLL